MNPQPAAAELTIDQAIRKGAAFLAKQGIEAARLEMELMMAAALGVDRLRLYLKMTETAPPEALAKSRAMLERRRNREPLAYILERKEFYGLTFEIRPGVLIPRPETEWLVDMAVKDLLARAAAGAPPPRCADIGTGSGAIAAAAAKTLRKKGIESRWIASDSSPAALEIARANAKRHGVEDLVDFREGSLLDPLDGPVDLLCSNPPYIPDGDRTSLAPDIVNFEPAEALFSGPEGLDHLRELIAGAAAWLNPGGALLLEIGFGQGEAVEGLLREQPDLRDARVHPDLAGIPRIAAARRTGEAAWERAAEREGEGGGELSQPGNSGSGPEASGEGRSPDGESGTAG